ncbi:MAG: hypothetical protein AAGA99_04055 [Actinomycetota bacterium]
MASPHLHDLPATSTVDEYERRRLDELSDHQLVEAVAGVIGSRTAGPLTSFVLHAPLELVARAALLPRVRPERRRDARLRLVWLAARYQEVTEPASAVAPLVDDVDAARIRLVAAIDDGDLDESRQVGAALARSMSADELVDATADTIAPRLAAAGHGAIFLQLLPRFASGSPAAAAMFGNLARDLARSPGLELSWQIGAGHRDGTGEVDAALRDVPALEPLESDFIAPNVGRVETSGLADDLLRPAFGGGLDVVGTGRTIVRVAADAMIGERSEAAPYTWTHALTIPAALAAIAHRTTDPVATSALAATYLAGFLASNATGPIGRPERELRPVDTERITDLATEAAAHYDAHVAKYVVAALDAARSEPVDTPRFVAAGERLLEVWRTAPPGEDPLAAALAA